MARKKKINFEEDFEGALFGIVTQLKDYRLCWHINKELSFDLIRMNDIEIIHKKKNKTAVFSLFRFENDLDKLLVHLVSNKHQGEHLIPEVRQADFILVIQGEVNTDMKDIFFSLLKNIPDIQLVIPVDSSRLKSKENLVFE
ncbi:MAG TPA: IPExxxVDY family protein [Chitinophagales bacterium]|nr:IPExxxVDY family protein [Chitinophagales bacterium]